MKASAWSGHDHAADLLLAPSPRALACLAHEGLAERAALVGDVVVDMCLAVRDLVTRGASALAPPQGLDPAQPYLVGALQRAVKVASPVAAR
ncbi:hypothetical protein [Nonomuraea dietziae]|uniref:hypothetical protein n=1 Tax=Nonomuraea dietziae TaxID=65515 RepID=UPI0033FEFE26